MKSIIAIWMANEFSIRIVNEYEIIMIFQYDTSIRE